MLCACLFSGGESRRMGQDKALLPHPSGGLWLTALVDQVRLLGLPLQVVSRHPAHGDQLADLPGVTVVQEPPPWQGPLQALGRVLPVTPAEALLVLPVDMPRLSAAVLQQLILRLWTRREFQLPIDYWWLMGAGGLIVGTIGPVSVWRTFTGKGWTWKGRSLR